MAIKKKQAASGGRRDIDKALAELQKHARATIKEWFKLKKLGALGRLPEEFDVTLFQQGLEPLIGMKRRGRPKAYKGVNIPGVNILPELKAFALAAERQSIKAKSPAERNAKLLKAFRRIKAGAAAEGETLTKKAFAEFCVANGYFTPLRKKPYSTGTDTKERAAHIKTIINGLKTAENQEAWTTPKGRKLPTPQPSKSRKKS